VLRSDMSENCSVRPIFVFSLPRSGSTLMQRILASHPEISSQSETWLLLPLFYSLRSQGGTAVYGHAKQVSAVRDLCKTLPGKEGDYLEQIESLAKSIYLKASCAGCSYFVDKTPRYHLIVEEIIKTFPDAKFIFLWRNPLSVIASLISTWGGGKWNLFLFYIDLYKGLENLVSAYQKHRGNVLGVRYEDFISDSDKTCAAIFSYLDLEYRSEQLDRISQVSFSGDMGDPTGSRQYTEISDQPAKKWQGVLNNPLRKFWCKRYLHTIGTESLKTMGYEQASLLHDLGRAPAGVGYILSDLVRMLYGVAHRVLDVPVYLRKLEEFRYEGRMYPHN